MHTRSWFGFWLVWLVALGAQAQVTPAEKAAAEALFDRGLTQMREGRLPEACTSFEQSQAIERGIGTMLYLADCYEKTGRTASAWALFREASSEARASGQSERAEAGRQRAERLEPTLGRLTIQVPESERPHKLEVLRNGVQVPAGTWGVPVPVDPGQHRVEVRAPGYLPYEQTVSIDRGPGSWKVELPKLVAAPKAAEPEPPPAPVQTASQVVPRPPHGERAPARTQRITGLVMGSAGVALLAVGAGMGVRAMKHNNTAKDRCPEISCADQEGVDASKSAKSAATISTAGLASGGALLAGGLLTYLLAPKGEAQIAFAVDQRGALLSVGGAF